MSAVLEQSLLILTATSIIVLIVIAIYIGMVLFNLYKLIKNLDETTTIVKQQVEPTITEFNRVLVNVNKVVDGAELKYNSTKETLAKVLGFSGLAFGGLKTFSGSFLKGFTSAMKLFMKK